MKTTFANALLALASLGVGLLVLEAGTRIVAHRANQGLLDADALAFDIEPPKDRPAELGHMIRLAADPRIVYALKPGLDVTYAGARVRTNSRGWRGPEVAPKKPRGVYRIVGIGDSFMFGYGVGDDEPYLALLEDRLRRRYPHPPIEVINTAVPGYNTVMEVATLASRGRRFDPDLVILEVVGNDLGLPNFIRRREDVLALDRSFLVELVKSRLSRRTGPRSLAAELAEHGITDGLDLDPEDVPPEYAGMIGWSAFARALRELRHLGRKHGFEILVISLAPDDSSFVRSTLAEARSLGLRTLDVGAVFRRYLDNQGFASYPRSPLALGPDDGHPSAFGHRIAAQVLVRYLIDEGLFPPMRRHAGDQTATWSSDRVEDSPG